jgi:hypothetical protein
MYMIRGNNREADTGKKVVVCEIGVVKSTTEGATIRSPLVKHQFQLKQEAVPGRVPAPLPFGPMVSGPQIQM